MITLLVLGLALAEPCMGGDSKTETRIDWTQTSWQDPFRTAFWKSKGWKFSKDSMQSAKDDSYARFNRTYRKLNVSFEVEPISDAKSNVLVIQLDESRKKSSVTIAVKADSIEVREIRDKKSRLIRKRKRDTPLQMGKPLRVACAATGNRLILILNGQRALVCSQPPLQSGRDIYFSLVSKKSRIRVRKMRIEGE